MLIYGDSSWIDRLNNRIFEVFTSGLLTDESLDKVDRFDRFDKVDGIDRVDSFK